jgi:hypothetical protein
VDRYLEARIEHEHSTIAFQEKETLVESYPISIEWPDEAEVAAWAPVAECRRRVIERLGLPPTSAWRWAWTASTTPRASWSG